MDNYDGYIRNLLKDLLKAREIKKEKGISAEEKLEKIDAILEYATRGVEVTEVDE